jgi:hypothetical protein
MSAEDVFNGTVDVVTGMSPEDHKQTVLTDESIDHALNELAELTPPLSGLPAAPSRTELRRLHPQVLTIPRRARRACAAPLAETGGPVTGLLTNETASGTTSQGIGAGPPSG